VSKRKASDAARMEAAVAILLAVLGGQVIQPEEEDHEGV
jgi:hypothetical protein